MKTRWGKGAKRNWYRRRAVPSREEEEDGGREVRRIERVLSDVLPPEINPFGTTTKVPRKQCHHYPASVERERGVRKSISSCSSIDRPRKSKAPPSSWPAEFLVEKRTREHGHWIATSVLPAGRSVVSSVVYVYSSCHNSTCEFNRVICLVRAVLSRFQLAVANLWAIPWLLASVTLLAFVFAYDATFPSASVYILWNFW